MSKTDNSQIYNSINEYGANQWGPYLSETNDPDEYHQLCMIIKSHFPELKKEEIDTLLFRLRKEGCGYVAMINSLFEKLIDKPWIFREKFGFNMFHNDGTLNFNHLLVDLYCHRDNHNGANFLFFHWDIYEKNEDYQWLFDPKEGKMVRELKPQGNNELQMKYRWESYCKAHDIETIVDINRLVNPDNFDEYSQKGSVSILCSDFSMFDDAGNTKEVKNGHFMTITGVNNNTYIVSSWGKKYYLNPEKIKGFMFYQVIRYKNLD